jgi:hypothetical protein
MPHSAKAHSREYPLARYLYVSVNNKPDAPIGLRRDEEGWEQLPSGGGTRSKVHLSAWASS